MFLLEVATHIVHLSGNCLPSVILLFVVVYKKYERIFVAWHVPLALRKVVRLF